MNFTVMVKVMNSLVVLGIKAPSAEDAQSLAREYFDKMGYDDAEITSCEEGLVSVEELQKMTNLMEAIPPSKFNFDLQALRHLAPKYGHMPKADEDLEEAKQINKELDAVEEGLPPWSLSESDKCFLMKYGISYK